MRTTRSPTLVSAGRAAQQVARSSSSLVACGNDDCWMRKTSPSLVFDAKRFDQIDRIPQKFSGILAKRLFGPR